MTPLAWRRFASIASRALRLVTMAERPSAIEAGQKRYMHYFRNTEVKYFSREGFTNANDLRIYASDLPDGPPQMVPAE
jgi:hypothetical protein